MSLAREHGRQAITQDRFHCRQQPHLVVDHDVMARRMLTLNRFKHLLLVNVDQHAATDRIPQARTLNLARLEYHVTVGEDHRRAEPAEVGNDLKRTRIKSLGEGVVDKKARHQEQPLIGGHAVFGVSPVAL